MAKTQKIKKLKKLLMPQEDNILIVRRKIFGVGVFKRVLKAVSGKYVLISEGYEEVQNPKD